MMALISLCFVAYFLGKEDGREDYQFDVQHVTSIKDAVNEAENCILKIYHQNNGIVDAEQHIQDALFWIRLAQEMSEEI